MIKVDHMQIKRVMLVNDCWWCGWTEKTNQPNMIAWGSDYWLEKVKTVLGGYIPPQQNSWNNRGGVPIVYNHIWAAHIKDIPDILIDLEEMMLYYDPHQKLWRVRNVLDNCRLVGLT